MRSIRPVLSSLAAVWLSSTPVSAGISIFVPVSPPCRLVDTRSTPQGGIISSGAAKDLQVTGSIAGSNCSIPNNAQSVALNVAVVNPSQSGFVSLWPAGQAFPGTSTINVTAGAGALANGAIVPLRVSGTTALEPSLQLVYGTSAPGVAHVVIDVSGYFIDANLHLWGAGRPGAAVYGRLGKGTGLCAHGDVSFGLSSDQVLWTDSAEVCPGGTWVCTGTERGSAACDTVEGGLCDSVDARTNTCDDGPDDDVAGWLADMTATSAPPGFLAKHVSREGGTTFTQSGDLVERPVWCCSPFVCRPNGQLCNFSDECCSGTCLLGKCQTVVPPRPRR